VSRSVRTDYEALRKHDLCEVCGVDHATSMADLSHGIIRLIEHSQERFDWQEWPISGDHIARQRAGITGPSLLHSLYWDEEDD
jgi:hypothetical protein